MLQDCHYFTKPPFFFLQARLADPQLEIQPHVHGFIELCCVLHGHGTHVTDVGSQEIGVGDVFVIPIGGVHAYTGCQELAMVNILFDPSRLPMPKIDMPPGWNDIFFAPERKCFSPMRPYPLIHFEPNDFPPIRDLAMGLVKESESEMPGNNLCLLGLFIVFLVNLMRSFREHNCTLRAEGPGVWRALNYMSLHYGEKFSRTRLARIAGMSSSTFLRHFKNATGTTPTDYMTSIRIENASRLLIDTDKTNAEIAIMCGFREESYMSRCFVRKTGQSPGALRKSWSSKPVRISSSNGISGKSKALQRFPSGLSAQE